MNYPENTENQYFLFPRVKCREGLTFHKIKMSVFFEKRQEWVLHNSHFKWFMKASFVLFDMLVVCSCINHILLSKAYRLSFYPPSSYRPNAVKEFENILSILPNAPVVIVNQLLF